MGARPDSFALTTPGPVRIYSTAEMLAMPTPTWQIDKILPNGGLCGVYGPPGVGKSFVTVDMLMSIASGRTWQERAVDPGYGLYVGAEGGTGIGKRIHAWLKMHKLKASDASAAGWVTEPVPITTDSESMSYLIDRIETELNIAPSLIVIDTLARCFDGDENTQLDMGRFVAGIDRLRKEFDASVIVVHHTRLDGDRERGNTAFRGAADTMLSLAFKKGVLTLTCNKQKDAAEFDDIELELEPVSWRDKDGTFVDSCVIASGRTAQLLEKVSIITSALADGPLSWDALYAQVSPEMSKATFNRYLVRLKENKEIIKENGDWRLS